MSRLIIVPRLQILCFRWVLLLSLFLFHIQTETDSSPVYPLLIGFNILFTWFHFTKQETSQWKVFLLMEVSFIFLLNVILPVQKEQLLYLYSTFLFIGIIFSKKTSLVLVFVYSILAGGLTFLEVENHSTSLFPLVFGFGFFIYLLLIILMESVIRFFKKWVVLLLYIEKLTNVYSINDLHHATEQCVKKILNIQECYLCLYNNNHIIEDWSTNYYMNLLKSNHYQRYIGKKKSIQMDSHLGEPNEYLFIPIKVYRALENPGGILIPRTKGFSLQKFDSILLRILLAVFWNHFALLVLQQEQAVSIKGEVRSQMAQDMHDGLAQQLFFLSAQLFQIKNNLPKGNSAEMDQLIQAMEQQASSCQNEVRSFIAHLKGEQRRANILNAIQELINRFANQSPVKIELESKGEFVEQSIEIEEAVYRIIEESISNTLKHAKATSIKLFIEITLVQWTIKVTDDGIGFEHNEMEKPFSYGLRGTRERVENLGGYVSLKSMMGSGTEVLVVIPRGGVIKYV